MWTAGNNRAGLPGNQYEVVVEFQGEYEISELGVVAWMESGFDYRIDYAEGDRWVNVADGEYPGGELGDVLSFDAFAPFTSDRIRFTSKTDFVSIAEIMAIGSSLGTEPSGVWGDINQDGILDASDIEDFRSHWLVETTTASSCSRTI